MGSHGAVEIVDQRIADTIVAAKAGSPLRLATPIPTERSLQGPVTAARESS